MSRLRIAAFLAVLGPGVLAGLSDDDPAGHHDVLDPRRRARLRAALGARASSTAALIVFHELGARMGVVTGQGWPA